MDKKALNHCEVAIQDLLQARKECDVPYLYQANIYKIREFIFSAIDELNKVVRCEELSDEDK